jgi:crotonobetainyl-CoA:carnitine CoA-transferase CaiB-like acyl-CoA transferase
MVSNFRCAMEYKSGIKYPRCKQECPHCVVLRTGGYGRTDSADGAISNHHNPVPTSVQERSVTK